MRTILGSLAWPAVLAIFCSVLPASADDFTTPNGTTVERTFVGPGSPKAKLALCADKQIVDVEAFGNFASNYLTDRAFEIVDADVVSSLDAHQYTLVYIGPDPLTSKAPPCLGKHSALTMFARADAEQFEGPVARGPNSAVPPGGLTAATYFHYGDDPKVMDAVVSICDLTQISATECRDLSVPGSFSLDGWGTEWDFETQAK